LTQFSSKINPDQPEIPGKQGKPRILLAPLDWGLGHATRCIPIIRELQEQGAEVLLAAEGAAATLLKEAFPELAMLNLEGYRVRYAKTKTGLVLKMLGQTPRLLGVIKREHRWLKKAVKDYQIDAVISDNRYGLYHSAIPCIFITHQLLIKIPFGKKTERWIQKINYGYIQRFSACWVPDHPASPGLAGELSHPALTPSNPVHYIGPLSRFEKTETTEQKNHLLLLLSGPEPQRSILEEKILSELAHYPGTATLVRGLPGSDMLLPSSNMIHIYNHLPTAQLSEEMSKASRVICRSGYSTLMDLAVFQKKSILVPTPGQTEQEYLALLYREQKTACTITQQAFTLESALQQAAVFPYHDFPQSGKNSLGPVISRLLGSLR
jgi:uncharacterized protein (TIGR00661 family)